MGDKFAIPDEDKVMVSSISQFKAPEFTGRNVKLWFAVVEGLFTESKIVSSSRRYNCLLTALPYETLEKVSDIILTRPPEREYEVLKDRVIKEYDPPISAKISTLLETCELGDRKPSVFLRELREVSAGLVQDDFLLALFLRRLPETIRTILNAGEYGTPEQAARIADRIWESQPTAHCTAVAQTFDDKLAQLSTVIDQLLKRLSALETERIAQRQSHSRLSIQRSHTSDRTNAPGLCYYHRKFGYQARTCRHPCSFEQ